MAAFWNRRAASVTSSGLLPDDMHSRPQITGIEIDSITARLAKTLYPDADIRHQTFENTKLADNFCDVAISNLPFGDYQPYDPRFKGWDFRIHDYFFAATLEKIRPGGLILFITSKGTMDKILCPLREYASQQADLLGHACTGRVVNPRKLPRCVEQVGCAARVVGHDCDGRVVGVKREAAEGVRLGNAPSGGIVTAAAGRARGQVLHRHLRRRSRRRGTRTGQKTLANSVTVQARRAIAAAAGF